MVRRYAAAGVIDTQRGLEAIDDFAAWPLTRYPHDLFLVRIWALRHNLTAYDAGYVALAEALQATLVTRETRWRPRWAIGRTSRSCKEGIGCWNRGSYNTRGDVSVADLKADQNYSNGSRSIHTEPSTAV